MTCAWRLMRERVIIRVRTPMLEKLLAKAVASGAVFARVERKSAGEALLTTDARGETIVLELARAHRLDAMVVLRAGAGEWMRRLRARWTYPASFLVVFLLVTALLGRIWVIDVRLLDAGMRAESLCDALTRAGVRIGMDADALDAARLRRALEAELPEYTFVGVRRQGTRLLVEAAIARDAPSIYDPERARDLVATRDAIIETIEVHAGTPCVVPGDVVRRGQTLISGEERDDRETTRGVAALGVVTARFWTRADASACVYTIETLETGNVRVSEYLTIFDWSRSIAQCDAFARETCEEYRIPIGGVFLPVSIVRTVHRETTTREKALDQQALRAQLSEKAFADARKLAPHNATVVDKWADYSMIEGKRMRVRAVLEYLDNIAATRDAYLSEMSTGGN